MPNVQLTLEVERVVNLTKGFGWEKVEETEKDGVVTITIKKTIPSAVPKTTP